MSDFYLGQRWVVDSEPELGLGTVIQIEGRTVQINFELGQCDRTYAALDAPLTRIQYAHDDEITTRDGVTSIVTNVQEQNGLVFYELKNGDIVPETSLSPQVQMNQPFIRLMTGQLDRPRWFAFKRELSDAVARLWQSNLIGLLGIRANLIPHQLYIAWNACERQEVRVLLADEVGLGKTVEAGMILSRLTKQERIQRALIVVPEALQVQWLVELVRRFSLHPEMYQGAEHDFSEGRIHIVSHEVLCTRDEDLIESHFDLIIVDEAHHIAPDTDEFKTLTDLSLIAEHLVLLTATPEQLGVDNHFARLKLLDPAKFTNLEDYKAQEDQYIQLSEDINNLSEKRDSIIKQYQLELPQNASENELIDQLLDCHGIGRVMFRNARSAVKGFPTRVAHPHSLENDDWETKFEWLAQFLKSQPEEKILVICHDIDNVSQCEDYLWKKHGLDAAVFHEEQDLIERDRAAAYFADDENGAQVLICSEIGSEGRNFQFSSNLVCMDLPAHPDVLEQRIGRLDRIGQKHDVNIHVLYGEGSTSHNLFTWYHQILNCIEMQNPAAATVHDKYWKALDNDLSQTTAISEAKALLEDLLANIREGRDALLELNSCRQPFANQLADDIAEFEKACPQNLVETASELLQFHFEETRTDVYSIIPSDKMLVPSLPGVPSEGCEITFKREIAAQRDDVRFVSWDAPLIEGLWDLLHYSELGSAAVAVLPSKQLPAGHCLLEAGFDVILPSDTASDCRPFLNEINVRVVALDMSENNLANALPEEALGNSLKEVKRHLAREVIKSKKEEIPSWYKKCEGFAETHKEQLCQQAIEKANAYYEKEIQRLEHLKKRNPLVTDADIEAMQEKRNEVIRTFDGETAVHLSALRLIIISDS